MATSWKPGNWRSKDRAPTWRRIQGSPRLIWGRARQRTPPVPLDLKARRPQSRIVGCSDPTRLPSLTDLSVPPVSAVLLADAERLLLAPSGLDQAQLSRVLAGIHTHDVAFA